MTESEPEVSNKKFDVFVSNHSEFYKLLEAEQEEVAKLVAVGRRPEVEVRSGKVKNMQTTSLEFNPGL